VSINLHPKARLRTHTHFLESDMSHCFRGTLVSSIGVAILLQAGVAGAQNLRGDASKVSYKTYNKCPTECMAPHCQSGFAPHEGWEKLHKSRCYHRCSAPHFGKRYCGSGPDFSTKGSVDCSGCATVPKSADFAVWTAHGSIRGEFEMEKGSHAVHWSVNKLTIDEGLISKYCGKLMEGHPTFNYHLHEEWNYPADRLSSVGDCSLENVGNHWDPTAACGPASGNEVCDKKFCDTRGKNYTCDARKFDQYSIAQYRLLSPSALFPDSVTCEFGDFSGMAGPIEGSVDSWSKAVVTKVHAGQGSMSATFGEITPWTLQGKPCSFGSLAQAPPHVKTYKLASDKYALDQLPENASVLVHCGNNYENANARFFCARLQ